MKTPTEDPEDFAVDMVDSYLLPTQIWSVENEKFEDDFDSAVNCAIIGCQRLILYAEDKEYFEKVMYYLNNM